MPRLVDQIREVVAGFAVCQTPPALIGGLALAAHQVVRATQDIDFLADLDDADCLHAMVLDLGYRCLHRNDDAANYRRGDEGLDFIYAHRPVARRLLAEAQTRDVGMGQLRVVKVEGLIGLKLQAYVNDPRRLRDLEDIRQLLRANRATLDMVEVRTYFELFERSELLSQLLAEDGHAADG